MSGISTHVLDAALGKPAANISVQLFKKQHDQYRLLNEQSTDSDGRIKHFEWTDFSTGEYRLIFLVKSYFEATNRTTFYPQVCIDFEVDDADQHYHVPLLMSPYSYSTYRGS